MRPSQTQDQQALADVLRAYGRIRDPDAARIIISFANSERAQVREAARQAVAMLGEVSAWQLRDTYETIVGKKPPRDWTWERTARELFGEFDRLRLSRVYKLFDDGMAAQRAARLAEMRQNFDKVLARNPLFERRAEMAAGYLAYARKVADEDREQALDALRRAERISADETEEKKVRSLRLTLEAEQALAGGVADQLLARRAIELDASNERARELLARMERGELTKQTQMNRYGAVGAIAGAALLAILVILLRPWRRRDEPSPGAEKPSAGPESGPEPSRHDDEAKP